MLLVFFQPTDFVRGIDVTPTPKGVQVDLHIVEQGVTWRLLSAGSSVKFCLNKLQELSCVDVTVHIEAMRNSR